LRISCRGAEITSDGVSKPTDVSNRHRIVEPEFGSFLVDAFLATCTGAQSCSGIAG
jgi:hypothetical protein